MIVFSHGVLHHVPDIVTAEREICRVLKPDGTLIVMLYARWSLNYLISIGNFRRLGLLALSATKRQMDGMLGRHLANARSMGILRYLDMKNFIHKNTDASLNPYSKVYDLQTVKRDFPDLRIVRSYKRFMDAPPLPVRRLTLEKVLGWHLWVHMEPVVEIRTSNPIGHAPRPWTATFSSDWGNSRGAEVRFVTEIDLSHDAPTLKTERPRGRFRLPPLRKDCRR